MRPDPIDEIAQSRRIEHIEGMAFVCDLHSWCIVVAVCGDDLHPKTLQFNGDLLAEFTRTQKQDAVGIFRFGGTKNGRRKGHGNCLQMAVYAIIPLMKSNALLKPRSLFLGLFSVGYLFLSACQATSEATVPRWSEPAFAGIPDAGKLSELSGLTRSNFADGVYWAINDGDNPAEIIAIDGGVRTLATFTTPGLRNIDWEDITNYTLAGKHYLAVADTGDNGGVRDVLSIHVFQEPADARQSGEMTLIRTLRFKWPDGARDAESLFASAKTKSFYLISKKRVPAELFALPFDAPDGSKPVLVATLEGIAQPDAETMNTKGDYGRYRAQITAADLSPDNRTIAVLNYQQINFFPMPKKAAAVLKPAATITLPWLPQAEGIAYSRDGKQLYIGSEQAPTPVIRYDRLQP
jgi:hypothetical protein